MRWADEMGIKAHYVSPIGQVTTKQSTNHTSATTPYLGVHDCFIGRKLRSSTNFFRMYMDGPNTTCRRPYECVNFTISPFEKQKTKSREADCALAWCPTLKFL